MNTKPAWLALAAPAALIVLAWLPAASQGKGPEPAKERVKRGAYLVESMGCPDCHSPKVMSEKGPVPDPARPLSGHPSGTKLPPFPKDLIGPDKWGGAFSNDQTAWAGPWGVSFGTNLTPDEETGIGSWTEESFIQAMRTGQHLGQGRPVLPPMPRYAQTTGEDLGAIFAYLMSIKPIPNKVPDPIEPPPPTP